MTVVGVAKGSFMDLAKSLGIYCAVSMEMGDSLHYLLKPTALNLL